MMPQSPFSRTGAGLNIYVAEGPDRGKVCEVKEAPILIGRNSPDVPLTDTTISRRHAELLRKGDEWLLRDLGSANGTYVNGVKVADFLDLKLGDQIRCGTTVLVFGGARRRGLAGELTESLRMDDHGNLVQSSITARTSSGDDSAMISGPENRDAVRNLRVLYELSKAIASIFDRQQLLEQVMDMIFDNFPADRGFILLQDNEADLISPQVIRYRTKDHATRITVSRTIVNHVISNREGVICSNAMRDPRFAGGQSVHDYQIRSALCVPISVRYRAIGAIYVDTGMAKHTYTSEQLRFLAAIGLQTGLALENARLYEEGVRAERLAAAGETVAYLSHSIKNVLQSLRTASELVEMGLNKERVDLAKKGWNILQGNLGEIQTLVLDMLAFSKERQPKLASTQLNDVVADTVGRLLSRAEEKQAHLCTKLDDRLVPISVDPAGIQQVILNLILNALEAMEDGGVVTITTSVGREKEAVISVKDTGPGLDPERMGHLFRPFHSTKGQGGTGLGLAVVKKIVEEHKGRVEVSSEIGKGTIFTIRIPCEEL